MNRHILLFYINVFNYVTPPQSINAGIVPYVEEGVPPSKIVPRPLSPGK
jgi:hypothetical protein